VTVPRRTPNDFADIVVYRDDQCREAYLAVENKAGGQAAAQRNQAIEQLFGNANYLRAPFGLYDEGDTAFFFNAGDFPPAERTANRLGDRNAVPRQYGETPEFAHIAGQPGDIAQVDAPTLGSRIRRAHYLLWAGDHRDPLLAFDGWSKLLFAKVIDERTTPAGQPRRFQIGKRETSAAVANRVHELFREATRSDPAFFPPDSRINPAGRKNCGRGSMFAGASVLPEPTLTALGRHSRNSSAHFFVENLASISRCVSLRDLPRRYSTFRPPTMCLIPRQVQGVPFGNAHANLAQN